MLCDCPQDTDEFAHYRCSMICEKTCWAKAQLLILPHSPPPPQPRPEKDVCESLEL